MNKFIMQTLYTIVWLLMVKVFILIGGSSEITAYGTVIISLLVQIWYKQYE